MRAIASILFSIVWVAAHADSPPTYSPFSIKSENAEFVAKVGVSDKLGKQYPWQWKYKLQVSSSSGPLWETAYAYDGYEGGLLSNDGKYFVYVSFWLFDDGPLVSIYSRGGRADYTAHDLNIHKEGLEKTASHRLWLNGDLRFQPPSGTPQALVINTVQGVRQIDLLSGRRDR